MTGFGRRLKELRTRAGLTQQALAVAAGMSAGHVAKIERGEADPAWSTVVRLAKELGAMPNDFLTDEET